PAIRRKSRARAFVILLCMALRPPLQKGNYGDLPSHTARRLRVSTIIAERPAVPRGLDCGGQAWPWENVGSYDFDTDARERTGSRTDEKEPHCNHSPAMF